MACHHWTATAVILGMVCVVMAVLLLCLGAKESFTSFDKFSRTE